MRASFPLAALFLCGCPPSDGPPGDEQMGLYQFRAEPMSLACSLAEVPSTGFDFAGTFSRFRDGGGMYLSLEGIARDAGFDGQIARSTHSAPRSFTLPDAGKCAPCDTQVVETVIVALLSKSQSQAVGDRCPARPLDGGIPGEDAGVQLPGSSPTGFDSVRACGELVEQIVATGTCDPACNCLLRYRLSGDRK